MTEAAVGDAWPVVEAAVSVAASWQTVAAVVKAASSSEGVEALARIVTVASKAELVPVEEVCAAWSEIALIRARNAATLAKPVEGEAVAAGERRVAVVLTAEGVEALGAVVEGHPLPWLVDGRELVDASGAVVFAAAPGAVTSAVDRRGARDLLLGLLAALVGEAGARK